MQELYQNEMLGKQGGIISILMQLRINLIPINLILHFNAFLH